MLVCALPSIAGAQVRLVNTAEDHAPDGCEDGPVGDCTLREAVDEDTATEIQLPHDTYRLASELSIDRPVTIRGILGENELPTLTRLDDQVPMRIVAIPFEISVSSSTCASPAARRPMTAAGSSSPTRRPSPSPTARSSAMSPDTAVGSGHWAR